VSLQIGPDGVAAPVLALIASARQSLWMEMYQLTDPRALDALGERARAGCDVRVTLDPEPYENEEANAPAFARLAADGVLVRWATARFAYTHAKAFTLDHARLVVMTLNLTAAGLDRNREYLLVDEDPADVVAAEALFVADGVGATAPSAARVVASPDGSRETLRALITGATSSLALETEELTDGPMIGALLDARARGVSVTVVGPVPLTDGSGAARLAAAGVVVRGQDSPPIHAKALVADGRLTYVGSANLTPTSLDRNRELGLRLDSAEIAEQIAAVVTSDAARGVAP
jgi:cardiolipin synthase